MVADIETDQKGIPILLKQYLKLGGRLLGFNLDRDFANALDGLIMVDLTRTDTKMLQRYLGRDGAAAFLDHHGLLTEGVRDMPKPLKELAGEKPGEQVGVSA